MKKAKNFYLLVCGLLSITLFAQDLPTIVPLSPNAASIAKYGEVPVGHFTGIPSVSIPIYNISSKELSLPLSLSYHAGGNRVESIASWVGLGWNLGSIPSISRSVKGIADEKSGGYFGKYQGNTVEAMWNLGSGALYDSYLGELFDGTTDSEPDIFNYSIPGESGKFFYNQDDEAFLTYPKSNTIIEIDGSGFKLTTQDGVVYVFNVIETTMVQGASAGSAINSSWKTSQIISATKKDTLHLFYSDETQISKTKSLTTKYHKLSSSSGSGTPTLPGDGSVLTTNVTNAKLIDSISFTNGHVKFNKNLGAFRSDLNGGYSLNNISVYNKNNKLISKHEFEYNYIGSGTESNKWMFLDKAEQVSVNSNERLTHSFTYNQTYIPSSRYSAAQDYWGYYNGHDSNVDLTPSYYIPNTTIQIQGANREVDPTKSKFGSLTKITYPTGGYTEFEFENNMAYANDLPPQYITDYQSLAGEEYFDINDPIPQDTTFTKQFTINNLPDLFLNNNNVNGGAIVSFIIGQPGCDLSGGANNCARFTVQGPSPATTIYDIPIEGNTFYLPNGTYELKASFDQSTPEYENFFFIAEWSKVDPNQTGNVYSGGLRVKEIKRYTNATAQPITKKYKYTTAYDSTVSSGDIFSIPNFSHENVIRYDYWQYDTQLGTNYVNQILYLRVRSTSNMQQVSHTSSAVGYKTVFEETDDPNETGYNEYHFTNARDESGNIFPYPPPESVELDRGQLSEQISYKKSGSNFDHVQKKMMTYNGGAFDNSTVHTKSSFGIKWGNLIISNYTLPSYVYPQNMQSYQVKSDWTSLATEIAKNFNENDSITSVTNHFYENDTHLLRTKTTSTSSDGKSAITKIKYPQDISSPSSGITALINQNRLAEVIESTSYKDENANGLIDSGELLSTQNTNYSIPFTNIVTPSNIQTAKGSESLENRIVFNRYYTNGNVREVSKENGTHIYYIWGYNEQYPIAKIENFTYAEAGSIQSLIDTAVSDSNLDDDRTIGASENEGDLRVSLDAIRDHSSLSNAQMTSYTYDPLIGVTSVTDASGTTSYFDYDGFNRLLYIEDKNGDVLEQYNYNYKLEEVIATLTSSASTVSNGSSVTFTSTASGGTGNFSYEWTVSNANLNTTTTTSVNNFVVTTNSNHEPNFTLSCKVIDTQTGEYVVNNNQVSVNPSYPALVFTRIKTSPKGTIQSSGQNVTYTADYTGGSGSYSFVWTKTNSQSTSSIGTNSGVISNTVGTLDCNAFTIKCVITDLITNEVKTLTKSMTCPQGGDGGPQN